MLDGALDALPVASAAGGIRIDHLRPEESERPGADDALNGVCRYVPGSSSAHTVGSSNLRPSSRDRTEAPVPEDDGRLVRLVDLDHVVPLPRAAECQRLLKIPGVDGGAEL